MGCFDKNRWHPRERVRLLPGAVRDRGRLVDEDSEGRRFLKAPDSNKFRLPLKECCERPPDKPSLRATGCEHSRRNKLDTAPAENASFPIGRVKLCAPF